MFLQPYESEGSPYFFILRVHMSASKGRKWCPKLVLSEWLQAPGKTSNLCKSDGAVHCSSVWNARKAAGSWSFLKLPKTCQELPQRTNMGWSLKTHTNFPIIDTFWRYFWKAIAPEASNSGTPKLGFKVQRVCTINRSPHPLLVTNMYGKGLSDYTRHLNIHHLLYITESTDSMIDS